MITYGSVVKSLKWGLFGIEKVHGQMLFTKLRKSDIRRREKVLSQCVTEFEKEKISSGCAVQL
jgi:hypothetical protein